MAVKKVPASPLPRPKREVTGSEFLQSILEKNSFSVGTLQLEYEDMVITLKYKKLKWLAKSRCISEATSYVSDDNPNPAQQQVRAVFNHDVYRKKCIQEMIIDPPFPLTDKVLEEFPDEIGEQFDAIIPDPFTGTKEVVEQKKELEDSSKEED